MAKAFAVAKAGFEGKRLVESFGEILERDFVQSDLEIKHLELIRVYAEELKEVQELFTRDRHGAASLEVNFMDAGVFFTMLFGSERFEPYIGRLALASAASMEGSLSMGRLQIRQQKRDAELNQLSWEQAYRKHAQQRPDAVFLRVPGDAEGTYFYWRRTVADEAHPGVYEALPSGPFGADDEAQGGLSTITWDHLARWRPRAQTMHTCDAPCRPRGSPSSPSLLSL